jgi:hypothetical protein
LRWVSALFGGDHLCLIPGEKPSDYHCFNQMMHEYIKPLAKVTLSVILAGKAAGGC